MSFSFSFYLPRATLRHVVTQYAEKEEIHLVNCIVMSNNRCAILSE